MTNYVYTIIYTEQRNFLLFKKNNKGYFFKNEPRIRPDGKVLEGAGLMAFPGGRFDEEGKGELKWENPLHIKFEAVREFKEECGSVLDRRVGKVGKKMQLFQEDVQTDKMGVYGGYFMRVSPASLQEIYSS